MAFNLPPPPGVNEFRSASWQDWFFKLRAGLISAFNTITLQGIPAGGDTNQVLTKVSPTSYDVTWTDVASGGIPAGGYTGDVLTKLSDSDYDADWEPPQDIAKPPANNIIHNSNFQVRDIDEQEIVSFETSAPYSQHVRRWYGVAAASGFETILNTSLQYPLVTIKRVSGSNTDYVRLIQILDTEDSLKWANRNKEVRVVADEKTGANVSEINFKITTGTGINESLEDYVDGLWTDQTEIYNESLLDPFRSFTLSFGQITQIAVELQVKFDSTTSADDEVFVYQIIIDDPGIVFWEVDDKPLAVVQRECQRYYQKLDLYLTTAEINIPISMRGVPTVTLGDAAAFTTTGTTADILIIKVDSSSDDGIHTVYLDAEL
jgi:hypothetical protein